MKKRKPLFRRPAKPKQPRAFYYRPYYVWSVEVVSPGVVRVRFLDGTTKKVFLDESFVPNIGRFDEDVSFALPQVSRDRCGVIWAGEIEILGYLLYTHGTEVPDNEQQNRILTGD